MVGLLVMALDCPKVDVQLVVVDSAYARMLYHSIQGAYTCCMCLTVQNGSTLIPGGLL